jgi:hypothetical protein
MVIFFTIFLIKDVVEKKLSKDLSEDSDNGEETLITDKDKSTYYY